MKDSVKKQIIEVLEIALSSKETKAVRITKAHAVLENRGLNLSRSTIEKFYTVLKKRGIA